MHAGACLRWTASLKTLNFHVYIVVMGVWAYVLPNTPPLYPIPLHPQSLLPPYQLPCKWDGMSAFGSRWSEMITMAQQTSSNVCHFIATETTSRSICNERSAWWMFFPYLHSMPFLKWVLPRFYAIMYCTSAAGSFCETDEVIINRHFVRLGIINQINDAF